MQPPPPPKKKKKKKKNTHLEGGNIPFGTPNNPLTFSFNVYVKQPKLDHKCNNLIYVPFILFEGISKSMLFNSILNFAILSVFKVRNVIIWQ